MDMAYNDVITRLRQERERLSLSQREMARFARMSQSNYSKIELGSRRLSFYELKYLCDTDIDLYYVFTDCKCSGKYSGVFLNYSYRELLYFLNIVSSVAGLRSAKYSGEWRREDFWQRGAFGLSDWDRGRSGSGFLSLRRSLEYNQCEMAAELGVDVKKLRSMENGRSQPDSELLCKLYQRFRISPAVVLEDKKGLRSEIGILLDDMDDGTGEDVSRFVSSLQRIS